MKKLNLGCGNKKIKGFINIDLKNADVIADVNKPLDFADSSCDEIRADALIEHLDIGFFEVVREMKRLLKPNGIFCFYVPNCFHWKARIKYLFGVFSASSGYHYDHHWLYKPSFMIQILEAQGFEIQSKHSDLFDVDVRIKARKRQ